MNECKPEKTYDTAEAAANGIELIAEERQRQIDVEGWSAKHDDCHARGELAIAGATYALNAAMPIVPSLYWPWAITCLYWPWDMTWWKPSTPIRDLTKAGALIAAEIDRLLRLEKQETNHE